MPSDKRIRLLFVAACPTVSGYSVVLNTDHTGDDIGGCSNGVDPNVASAACNSNALCQAFSLDTNFDRYRYCLKTTADSSSDSPGVCLYTREFTPD